MRKSFLSTEEQRNDHFNIGNLKHELFDAKPTVSMISTRSFRKSSGIR